MEASKVEVTCLSEFSMSTKQVCLGERCLLNIMHARRKSQPGFSAQRF